MLEKVRKFVIVAVLLSAFTLTNCELVFKYGPRLDEKLKTLEDDQMSLELDSSFRFFGTDYFSATVHAKGFVTLHPSIQTYNPGINLEKTKAFIGPFYSDISLPINGSVWYRKTNDPSTLETFRSLLIKARLSADDASDIKDVFVFTWEKVGKMEERSNIPETNTFQLALARKMNKYYVFIQYERIEWTVVQTSDMFSKPLAALSDGFGKVITLPGSGTINTQNLVKYSNIGEAGKFLFDVSMEKVYPTNFEMVAKKLNCQKGSAFCSAQKGVECIPHYEGFCCSSCPKGSVGNGFNCVKLPVGEANQNYIWYFSHALSVSLNGEKGTFKLQVLEEGSGEHYMFLNELDGVTSRKEILMKLLPISPLGFVFFWLHGPGFNGFELTGGNLRRKARIYKRNDRSFNITIDQNLEAADDNWPYVTTTITGNLPAGNERDWFLSEEINTFRYIRVGRGKYTMNNPLKIQNKETKVFVDYEVRDEIVFDECKERNDIPEFHLSLSMLSNWYESDLNRWSFIYKGSIVMNSDSPCVKNKIDCGPNGHCAYNSFSTKCECNVGYEEDVRGHPCIDTDECYTSDPCDPNAFCQNTPGSFTCTCKSGYIGDGQVCNPIDNNLCGGKVCIENEECWENKCECKHGYERDEGTYLCVSKNLCNGVICPESEECKRDYSGKDYCDCKQDYVRKQGVCVWSTDKCAGFCTEDEECREEQQRFYCVCVASASGEVGACDEGTRREICYGSEKCLIDAHCDDVLGYCKCNSGFEGDGYQRCDRISSRCSRDEDCDLNALCQYDGYERNCVCKDGYEGNGQTCWKKGCERDDECDPRARCLSKTCVCTEGYIMSNNICVPSGSRCERDDECDINARCQYDSSLGYNSCVCFRGFEGDGKICKERDACIGVTCGPNEECVSSTDYLIGYQCECISGYRRSGSESECKKECGDEVCDARATCVTSEDFRGMRCKCNEPLFGNGLMCFDNEPDCFNYAGLCDSSARCDYETGRCKCRDDEYGDPYYMCKIKPNTCEYYPEICHPMAECKNEMCECMLGYSGDGERTCEEIKEPKVKSILLARHDSIYRIPLPSKESPLSPKFNVTANLLQAKKRQIIVSVDYNCENHEIYYGDSVGHKIVRYNSTTGKEETILAGRRFRRRRKFKSRASNEYVSKPQGMAYDWTTKNLYYTDRDALLVGVVNVVTKKVKVLAENKVKKPRGIAIDPEEGLIFWTDWETSKPRIERMNMDGSDRRVIFQGSRGDVLNDVAVNRRWKTLCWCNARMPGIIQCSQYDGTKRKIIFQNAGKPFGLLIVKRNAIWSDREEKQVESVPLDGIMPESPTKIRTPLTGSRVPLGIAAIPENCPPVSNWCQRDPCYSEKEICLQTKVGRKCVCPGEDC
ncbi:DgyrCDS11493 [Dimorphilus gyrociliatus]|uniref:DgyrCDS11493 n=1 Tax=Dimorphilus gyrociliatus TaxID=2664684 RepID=A0A7I8W4J4_9ANNE|nr:DgyrCDS11493 [Dimorphilus gyrociliatus]